MKKSFEIYSGEYVAEYVETDDKYKDCWDRIIEFCKKHEIYSGESGCQDDDFNVYAPDLLSDIIDEIIKFNVIEK